ncbi:sulfatase-like hydrolase/transferase [Mucilaginibacter gotjawali]|uniref:Arylsulfatase A-like enzyme n=1 Tax=Mucilaginibacter gotjawali TaxID=1550579 RepID=A0A839SC34_9SPHI|nr:sulfatase-like hydrolase/transferase [Mucilaginibacter gotjawali]MBB3054470.1 arylsulfatase A-like enzyme [Mucilaginibacter gotjawali]
MIAKRILLLGIVLVFFTCSCKKNKIPVTPPTRDTTTKPGGGGTAPPPGQPNIIFILADDMGYEMPTFDGGESYNTSHLDSLAANAMVFNQCRGTPLCSPSRVELLSGVYNYRNYLQLGWGAYNRQYISYAKTLQNNGYKTCVVGKWQLDGGNTAIEDVGFDDYCVWDASTLSRVGYMYKDPTLYDPMGVLPMNVTIGKYSEDITSDYALSFIDQNKDKPFFIYYSFMLVHQPHQPTPLDASFQSFDDRIDDTTYIGSMTHYLDLKVGVLINKLKADGLDKNTIIVFTGDNGSEVTYHSLYKGKMVAGEKGQTTEFGTHVPLFVYWPGYITPGVNNNLIDFTDFAPTFLDMAKVKSRPPGDGVSFYPQLFGNNGNARNWTYCYFDPYPFLVPNVFTTTKPISYAQDTEYKLYNLGNRKGLFYHFTTDLDERYPIKQPTPAELVIKQKLQKALSQEQLP